MTKKKEKKPELPSAPVGRPSSYDPKYCQMLVTHMAEGLSFESFAGVLGHSKQTLYTWMQKHREFMDAKSEGDAKSLLWWEKEGRKGLWDETDYNGETGRPISKRSLNASIWIFNMKNRHRWKDRQEIELDATVTTNPLKEDLKKKTTEELLEIMRKTKKE